MQKNIIFFIIVVVLNANGQEAMPPTISSNPTPSPTWFTTTYPTASKPTTYPTASKPTMYPTAPKPTMYPTAPKPTMYPTAPKPTQKKKKPTRNPNYVN